MLKDRSPLQDRPPEAATLDHDVWDEIKEWFKPSEFEAPEKMDANFLRKLAEARALAKCPFRIIDSVRDDPRSAHGEIPCACVDLQVLNSWERSRVVRALYAVGFVRVGVYEGTNGTYKGKVKKDGGGVHVDASRTKPQDRCWTQKLTPKTFNE